MLTAPDPTKAGLYTGAETDSAPVPAWSPDEASDSGTGPGLDQPMQLARWPNRGMVPVGKVLDPGSAPRDGDLSNRGATFTYDYDRPARWTHANDLWRYLGGDR